MVLRFKIWRIFLLTLLFLSGCVTSEKEVSVADQRLGVVNIMVGSEADRALRFYRDTLGFSVKPLPDDPGTLAIENGNGPVVLLYPVTKAVPFDYPNQTGVVLSFYVDSLDQHVQVWAAKGVELVRISWSKEASGIAQCPFGRFIAIRDPWGNVLEMIERPKGGR